MKNFWAVAALLWTLPIAVALLAAVPSEVARDVVAQPGALPSAAGGVAAKRQHDAPRSAVLDFRQLGKKASRVDPWSFGLADFFAAALEERGLPIFDRRAIRSVLSERALGHSGLVVDTAAVRVALPQLRFLVSGTIEALADDRFRIVVSALDTEAGLVASELSAEGHYPDELAAALGRLAEGLEGSLAARDREAPAARPATVPGFTRNPDVAVQFYKGLDHLVHGRPEFAAEYFRQAWLADREFWVAAAWRMRAYEALGLSDLARYVRSTLLADPAGRRVFELVAPSLAHERGRWVMAVSRPQGESAQLRQIEAEVRELLGAQPRIDVLSPEWIRRLAGELDLRLSGEISAYAVEEQAWLAADLVLHIQIVETVDAFRIDLVDAISGARVAGIEPTGDWRSQIPKLVAQLGQRTGETGNPWRLRELEPLDYAMPDDDIARYSLQAYAYLLRDFAENPNDPRRIASHIEMHTLHSHAEYEPGIYDREWGILEPLWKRVLASVEPDDPDAANWLSLALWRLRLHGFHNGDGDSPNWWYNRGRPVPSIGEHFAPLLRQYPESLAALCVRYSLALEHAMRGRHEQAAEILLELARRPHEEADLSLDYGVTANLYLMTAIEAERVGRATEASGYVEKARLHAERFARFRDPEDFRSGRPIGGRDAPVEPVIPAVVYTAPGRGGHHEGRWYVASMPKTVFIDWRVRFMRAEGMNGQIAAASSTLDGSGGESAEAPLGIQYRRAIAAQGAAGIEARLAYLRRVSREMKHGSPVSMSVYYGRPEDTLLPWLDEHVSGAGRKTFEAVVGEFVEAGRERRYLRDHLVLALFAAAGMDDAVLGVAEAATLSRSPADRGRGVVAKAGVIERRQGPGAAARYLDTELRRFELDFETARGMRYLDLVHACGRAHEAAGELAAAVGVYRRALEARLFDDGMKNGEERAPHHRASIRFRLAALEAERGNAFEAAELLKQVIERSEAHPDWLLHYTGHNARSVGKLPLYRAALQELGALRSAS